MSGALGIKSKRCIRSREQMVVKTARSVLLTGVAGLVLAGCVGDLTPGKNRSSGNSKFSTSSRQNMQVAGAGDHINDTTKFSSSEFGVKGSPRVTTVERPRKGGGRYQIGKPYKIKGRWYKPRLNPHLKQVGLASWYGANFHGRLTANGEIYDQYALTAAHPTMPLPSYARVTNLENGRKVTVRVNDRGPYAHNRVIDLSARAAKLLGYDKQGVAKVKVEYAGKAPLDGLDEKKLMASYVGPKGKDIGAPTRNLSGSGTMLAMADTSEQIRPAAAISSAFPDSELALSSGTVAIPTIRPTIFEGIPLAAGETTLYRVRQQADVPRPVHSLSYVNDSIQDEADPLKTAITHIKQIRIAYYGIAPAQKIVLNIGQLDVAAVEVLRDLTDDLAGATIETADRNSRLIVPEEHANTALERMRKAGLSGSYIQ